MTKLIHVKRGVKKSISLRCRDCRLSDRIRGIVIVCDNPDSDHYQHLILSDHPACKQIVKK